MPNPPPSPHKSWITRLLNAVGLTNEPTVKVYRGYGHKDRLVLFGHVFRYGPLPRTRYDQTVLGNTASLLRGFMVAPLPFARVRTQWQGRAIETQTDKDGFFALDWVDEPPLEVGWHPMKVELLKQETVVCSGDGALYIPHSTQTGYISDIDDTFLVSHSASLGKRLRLLFTANAHTRKPFEGVVEHYNLLAKSTIHPEEPNPFFFVSSSEWNLYDFLLEFSNRNGLPKGVFLLNMLKRFSQVLKTGGTHHSGKLDRIRPILEGFPTQRFVLLGDSSQRDPYIYLEVVKLYPGRIRVVYIRDVHAPHRAAVKTVLAEIETLGVPTFFFEHSSDAIAHSKEIGLIAALQPTAAAKERADAAEEATLE